MPSRASTRDEDTDVTRGRVREFARLLFETEKKKANKLYVQQPADAQTPLVSPRTQSTVRADRSIRKCEDRGPFRELLEGTELQGPRADVRVLAAGRPGNTSGRRHRLTSRLRRWGRETRFTLRKGGRRCVQTVPGQHSKLRHSLHKTSMATSVCPVCPASTCHLPSM